MPTFRNDEATSIYFDLNRNSIFKKQSLPKKGLDLLVLHVSEGCNLGCSYCFADKGQYGAKSVKWMDDAIARKAIDFCYEKYEDLKAIKFFGGEPFLRMETVIDASRYSRKVSFDRGRGDPPALIAISNLTRYDSIVDTWIKEFSPSITASIDGPAKIHDSFRIYPDGRGSFDLVDQNIKRMLSETGQPNVLECVYSPIHLQSGLTMIDVHKFLKERYEIQHIIIHPMQGKKGIENISKFSYDKYVSSIYELSLQYGKFLMLDTLMSMNSESIRSRLSNIISGDFSADAHCGLGIHTITVQASGSISPCYTLIGKNEFEMGTISDNSSSKFETVVQRLISNTKSENSICQACSIQKTCHSCPGDMVITNGLINSPVTLTCDYLTGFCEGQILAINQFRSTDQWDYFDKNILNF